MMRTDLEAFWTPKNGSTGMATWIIRIKAKMIVWQTLNLIWSKTMASKNRSAQSCGMSMPPQMFPNWFGQYGIPRDRLKLCWWRSMQWTGGWIWATRYSKTECVNNSPAARCSLTESFSWRYITGQSWAVACKYQLINRCIAGVRIFWQEIYILVVWERTVHEYYYARLCRRAKSQSVRKTTNKFKSWCKQLLMAANIEWTIH